MSNEDKNNTGRRKLLKSVVAGGGAATVAKILPDQWARPVVDSVMLPSHAQTSKSPFGPFVNASGPFVLNETDVQMAEQGFSEELLEFFAPAAHAGIGGCIALESMSFTANSSGDSFLCGEYNLSTQVIAVQVSNGSFTSSECLHGYPVAGGSFNESAGWVVSFVNSSTTVTLTEGGSGCSSSNTAGSCSYYPMACPD
ncbi:MAG: hypothetical protein KAJ95_01580 [Gammaproteobacteria bacterium]|nr:hypothetical protein [Gammaproteobacteria bacterium]